MPGGGRCETWRALDFFLPLLPSSVGRAIDGPSIALFAPHLAWRELEAGQGARWDEADRDDAFWWLGPDADGVPRDIGLERERRQREDIAAVATYLAESLASSTPMPRPPPPTLPDDGVFRPISAYVRGRPPPRSTTFFSSFTRASADMFRLEGESAIEAPWRDEAVGTAEPDLCLPQCRTAGVRSRLVGRRSWIGGHALELISELPLDRPTSVPLFTVDLVPSSGFTASVIWTTDAASGVAIAPRLEAADGTALEMIKTSTTELPHGWMRTTCELSAPDATRLGASTFAITLTAPAQVAVLVGSVSTDSVDTPLQRRGASDVRWTPTTRTDGVRSGRLSWRHDASTLYAAVYAVHDGRSTFLGTSASGALEIVEAEAESFLVRALSVDGVYDSVTVAATISVR